MSDYFTGWTKNEKLEVETFKSSCHCERFEFEFRYPTLGQVDGPKPMTCNCTICHDRAYLLVFTPPDDFKIIKGDEKDLTIYQFHRKVCEHKFCPTCGTTLIERIPSMGVLGVNLRTVKVPQVDYDVVKTIETRFFDGKNTM